MSPSSSKITPCIWLDEDPLARDRAFEAMVQMKKLDIAALKRAFEGR